MPSVKPPRSESFAGHAASFGLRSPADIQAFLNALKYNDRPLCKSPLRIFTEGSAHCAEGAYFAAAALRELGHPPLVVDLAAENDDDHVIAVYRKNRHWGSLAKSNTTVLRSREPVYRSLRELVMSYFDFYFNVEGFKSLRSYTRAINLSRFDERRWVDTDEDLEFVGDYLFSLEHRPVLPEGPTPEKPGGKAGGKAGAKSSTAREAAYPAGRRSAGARGGEASVRGSTGGGAGKGGSSRKTELTPADPDLVEACFLKSLRSGLYKPD